VIIKEMEVSLDFYPNDHAARAGFVQLIARLQMSLAACGRNHRLVGVRPSGKRALAGFLDNIHTPDPQRTFYVNDQDKGPVS